MRLFLLTILLATGAGEIPVGERFPADVMRPRSRRIEIPSRDFCVKTALGPDSLPTKPGECFRGVFPIDRFEVRSEISSELHNQTVFSWKMTPQLPRVACLPLLNARSEQRLSRATHAALSKVSWARGPM